MGLGRNDKKPEAIALAYAYERIRRWASANVHSLEERLERKYTERYEALIAALPPACDASELEIRAVLGEVIYGNLEWAYHDTDGQYKMGAYAHGALEAAGLVLSINEAERTELKGSILWPHLTINR